jgi:hypothetical protein
MFLAWAYWSLNRSPAGEVMFLAWAYWSLNRSPAGVARSVIKDKGVGFKNISWY